MTNEIFITSIKKRIEEYREKYAFTDNKMCTLLGISPRTYRKFMDEGKTIGVVVQNLAMSDENLNMNWLFHGTGCMRMDDERECLRQEGAARDTFADDADYARMQKEIEQARTRVIDLERQNAVLEYRLKANIPG